MSLERHFPPRHWAKCSFSGLPKFDTEFTRLATCSPLSFVVGYAPLPPRTTLAVVGTYCRSDHRIEAGLALKPFIMVRNKEQAIMRIDEISVCMATSRAWRTKYWEKWVQL